MSLVGSLEDLGLGDILQIVSLSRKSGLLLIRSEQGEGRIVFCEGLVRAAYVKGEPEDLRSLLVGSGFVGDADFDRAAELATARGTSVAEALSECTSLTRESLDSVRREQVERAVFRVFCWSTGEFSFEVRDQIDPRDLEMSIPTGINAQYLTMEATRLRDEGGREDEEPATDADDDGSAASEVDDGPLMFSGETASEESSDPGVSPSIAADADPLAAEAFDIGSAEAEGTTPDIDPSVDVASPEDALAFAAVRREAPQLEAPSKPAKTAASLIAIDPQLSSLEWQKLNLSDSFPRVHIFQSGESGIARIRQYLRRGEVPVVLVSIDLATEKSAGVDSLAEFIRRLKLLAPSMPVLVVQYEGARSEESIDAADAIITGPDPASLVNRRAWPKLKKESERFRAELAAWLHQPVNQAGAAKRNERGVASDDSNGPEKLRDLRSVSESIRDPANQGEVLKLVLAFASERFSRVALFMVRDDVALGVAQIGLPRGGGPDEDAFREVELRAAEVEWFKAVLESRSSLHAAVTGEGDRALARKIGDREPAEAYIAPIMSGGRVVALLYGDNLPGAEPIGDTSVIEIALHEAGLALERVLLQRALAQIGDSSNA